MPAGIPRPSVDENISTTISSGISDVSTTITVADASKIVSPCYLVIDRVDSAGALKATSLWEYVKVTNVAGSDLTTTRAQSGSTAQSHSAGAVVEAVVTSAMFEDWYAVLNPEHDSAGGHVITGTMTIAGMNLASVATLARATSGYMNVPSLASIANLYVTSYIGASGASVVGFDSRTNVKARAYQNTQQTNLTDTSVVTVTLDAESYDVGGNFASNTFTAPTAGYYLINGLITYSNPVADSRYDAMIYADGSSIASSFHHTGSDVATDKANLGVNVTTIAYLTATQAITLRARVFCGASTVDILNAATVTYLEVHLLSI